MKKQMVPCFFPKKLWKPFLFLLGFLLVTAWFIQSGPRYLYRFWGYLWLEKVENRLTEKQLAGIQQSIKGLRAKIVWSSSRTGNHEIFLLTLPDLKMYQITHNKHVDFFPRFSPDGEKILFCRSQRPWVSEREVDPWDVYLFSFIRNEEILLLRDANFPQWSIKDRISLIRKIKL